MNNFNTMPKHHKLICLGDMWRGMSMLTHITPNNSPQTLQKISRREQVACGKILFLKKSQIIAYKPGRYLYFGYQNKNH